ncbi:MAG: glucose-6-phosphate isomerase [Planctomycetota bacterium]|nr:MAG: glucose-6-phosphate isomerase [Planctomycetota bacterium]
MNTRGDMGIEYVCRAARQLLDNDEERELLEPDVWEKATQQVSLPTQLLRCRDEVFEDVALWRSGEPIPLQKRPLDAGFVTYPGDLLEEAERSGSRSTLAAIDAAAATLREKTDRCVLLGIGGSYMGARALFEALCHPYHNELRREERLAFEQRRRGDDGADRLPGAPPRICFEGNNLDNDATAALLELLRRESGAGDDPTGRWGMVVISKSGGTIETAVAFRLFLQAFREQSGGAFADRREQIVVITGRTGSKLRELAGQLELPHVLEVPDGIGGRFSVLTPVGLVPAAMLGLDVRDLLRGAADMTETFRREPFETNPVLQYVATAHLFEQSYGCTIRVLSTWGKRLEAVGLWYDQLLAESLGKRKQGATPLTTVNTRDLHSRGQQHQDGRRDKLITNVLVREPSLPAQTLPELPGDADGLNQYTGKTLHEFLRAAWLGTNLAYAEVRRPTADIVLPRLDEYHLGQLFQMLMLATVVEGRLIGVNPYGQPGVEQYKRNMKEALAD